MSDDNKLVCKKCDGVCHHPLCFCDAIWQEMVPTTSDKIAKHILSEPAFKALFKTAVAKAKRVVADAVARSAMVEAPFPAISRRTSVRSHKHGKVQEENPDGDG